MRREEYRILLSLTVSEEGERDVIFRWRMRQKRRKGRETQVVMKMMMQEENRRDGVISSRPHYSASQ